MQELDVENFYIELIENYPCNDVYELRAREGYHIREIGTLNKIIAGRSQKKNGEKNIKITTKNINDNMEYFKEYDKQYKENNQQNLQQYRKQYRQFNIDKCKERDKQNYEIIQNDTNTIMKLRKIN